MLLPLTKVLVLLVLAVEYASPPSDAARPAKAEKKRPVVEPVVVAMLANADGTLNALHFAGSKAIEVQPETNPARLQAYIRKHPKRFVGYQKAKKVDQQKMQRRAGRQIGEDRAYAQLAKQASSYVRQERKRIGEKAAAKAEFTLKIQFSYHLRWRYLMRAMEVCQSRKRTKTGKPVGEDLITNVEFIRPAPPRN